MGEYTPLTKKAEAEVSAIKSLRQRKPILFCVLVVGLFFFLACSIYERFAVINENQKLKTEREELRAKLAEKANDISRLQSELNPFKTAALLKFGGTEQEALKKLSSELEALQKTIASEQKMIRSFSASVSLNVSGDWTSGKPRPDSLVIFGNKDRYVTITSTAADSRSIVLSPTQVNSLIRPDGRYGIEYLTAVQIGAAPIGSTTDDLLGFNICEITVPLVNAKFLSQEFVTLDDVEIQFYVNGAKWRSVIEHPRLQLEVPKEHNIFRLLTLKVDEILKSK